MHFHLGRRNVTGCQHIHPTQAAEGTWSTPVTLGAPGTYRVFADFSVGGRPRTLADDVTADGDVRSQPLPAPARAVTTDGLRVALDASRLAFSVTRAGRPVALEDYLGAKGHLVALRQGDLAFLHVHPDESSLRFLA